MYSHNWKWSCKHKMNIFLQSWSLFSNCCMKTESTAAWFFLFTKQCSANVLQCIQLFAIIWISAALHPPRALVSAPTEQFAHCEQWMHTWPLDKEKSPPVVGHITSCVGMHAACRTLLRHAWLSLCCDAAVKVGGSRKVPGKSDGLLLSYPKRQHTSLYSWRLHLEFLH